MSKRTKEWWDKLGDEKGFVWYFERNRDKAGCGSDYLPDDCVDCAVCGQPAYLSSPCRYCLDRYLKALAVCREGLDEEA